MKFLSFGEWKKSQTDFYLNRERPYTVGCPLIDEHGPYEYCDICADLGFIEFSGSDDPTMEFLSLILTKEEYLNRLIEDSCRYDRAVNNPIGKSLIDMGYQVHQSISNQNLHLVEVEGF